MNIYILLDRSGSMQSNWSETIGSINGYVTALDKSFNVTLAVFDSLSHNVIRNTKAGDWVAVTNEEVSPRGGTPLFDSAARMMWRILDDNPEKAVFVVLTDGYENESKYFNQSGIKRLMAEVDSKKYETVFLGADFDKVGDVSATFNKGLDKTVNMTRGNYGTFMTNNLARASMVYASGAGTMSFNDQDHATAAGGVKK